MESFIISNGAGQVVLGFDTPFEKPPVAVAHNSELSRLTLVFDDGGYADIDHALEPHIDRDLHVLDNVHLVITRDGDVDHGYKLPLIKEGGHE